MLQDRSRGRCGQRPNDGCGAAVDTGVGARSGSGSVIDVAAMTDRTIQLRPPLRICPAISARSSRRPGTAPLLVQSSSHRRMTAGDRRRDRRLHLYRFDRRDRLAGGHFIADIDLHGHHATKRCAHMSWAGRVHRFGLGTVRGNRPVASFEISSLTARRRAAVTTCRR